MMQLIGAERTKMKAMLLAKQQQPQVARVSVESTSGSGHPGIIVTTPATLRARYGSVSRAPQGVVLPTILVLYVDAWYLCGPIYNMHVRARC